MKGLTVLLICIVAIILVTAAPKKNRSKNKSKLNFGLSKKFDFWRTRAKNKLKSLFERQKDRWQKVQKWLKKYKKNKNLAKMKRDNLRSHYSKRLLDKVAQGKKLLQSDIDSLENQMFFNNRKGRVISDAIYTINRANDVMLKEMDIKEVDIPKDLQVKLGSRRRRDAMRERYYLWQNRIVPYEIDTILVGDTNTIEGALSEIASRTCVRFVRRTTEKNWIKFVKKNGCWSNVGKVFFKDGFQEISIGQGCMFKGTIQHEVMHTLGFYHEQARPDRDQYVQIFFENVADDQEHNFERQPADKVDTLKIQYDFGSVMHYGKYAFALDPSKATIQSRQDPDQQIGQRNGVSDTDIEQINILYSCSVSGGGWSEWSSFGPCSTDCFKERSRFCMDPNDKTSCPNPTSYSYVSYGVDLNKISCSDAECKGHIDGHWSDWGPWGDCSTTCDAGTHFRTRACSNPAPQNGGKQCEGSPEETKECLIKKCNAGSGACTFDDTSNPLCGWSQGASNDFNWIRQSGSTLSSSTGPSGDQTSGTGFYMYIETSAPAQPGWKAQLISPTIPAGVRCMKFAYHMYGASIGSLSVSIKDQATQGETTVFTKSGNQLNEWHIAEVTISGADLQIIIKGARGSSYQGDIAVDDIEITDGACADVVVPTEPSVPTVSRIGCYNDAGFINGQRTFPMYADLSGLAISSTNVAELKSNYVEIVNYCASLARNNGFKYFALQKYYECWTGDSGSINYGRDGESTGCWPEIELNAGPYLVGQYYSNMVYQWNDL